MSDDLDIRSGGAIAVDTDTLRRVADRSADVAAKLADVGARLLAERIRLLGLDEGVGFAVAWIDALARNADWASYDADALTGRLRHAATMYEVIELRAQRAAAAAGGDAGAVAAAERRLATIRRTDPVVYAEAICTEATWWLAGPNELAGQAGSSPLGAFGASAIAAAVLAVGVNGRGRIARGAVLDGPAATVDLQLVGGVPTAGTAPTSLVSVVDRMPTGEARVRVERYAMPDGSARFAVYVTGTRSVGDGAEPWNMQSNMQLYAGERGASYDATLQALRSAGAQEGDAIYEFGHSQGAMVASHIALEGGYDTRALVTFGSPVSADVGPDILSVALRHTDDPVVALADGGNPANVGAAGSFIAERVADPRAGIQDAQLAAHQLTAYRETAAMLDSSLDPRAGALDAVFGVLGSADSVTVYEYAATRGPVLAPAPDHRAPVL